MTVEEMQELYGRKVCICCGCKDELLDEYGMCRFCAIANSGEKK